MSRSFHHPDDYTPSVDSAMESWDSSNTDHRFSDNSEATKEIIVNDHQQYSNYQDPSSIIHTSRSKYRTILVRVYISIVCLFLLLGDFVLKPHQTHSVPITIHSNRSMSMVTPTAGFRTPPTNGRPLEAIRHSDSGDSIHGADAQFSSVLNDKSSRTNVNFYDTKYDNCSSSASRPKYDTVTLVLNRDKRVLDFGFSISDRLYGTGVYVNKIRPNGPAELEGTLVPCMRIYKVR